MQTLDKYQILEKIGVGGFGVVYKAYDPFIKRHVAIKTCTSEESETRERFMREAEIAGNLHHRNIVTVYDFGFKNGVPYLVQEYLSGEDLDRKIKRREYLSVPEKLLYLVQIVRGLQYAHSRGVVHRDIKPANIRILDDDTAKIMDFGIAKLAQHQESLTQAGITLGTANYLAPEQIRGEAFDARTDIFSFGILAYELFAQERPFQGAEISAVFYKILNEEAPPLREKAPDCPEELEKIVHRCLEKAPENRYAGCTQLLHDIEELAHRRPRETAERQLAVQPAAARAADGPPASEPERTTAMAARPLSVGDIELDSRQAVPHSQSEGLVTLAFETRRRGRGSFGVGFVLVAILAVGGWLGWRYWQEIQPAPGRQETHRAASAAGSSAPIPSPLPTPAAGQAPPDSPPAVASPPAGAGVAAVIANPVAQQSAPAAAPPVPQVATLTIAPAWDSRMTLRIGSKTWTLDRERRIELAPGSYKARFAIETPAYSHTQETAVRLRDGESRRLVSPLEKPGKLTVQPHINTRQAFVRLDGAAAVATPMRGRWVAPGPHLVEIVAAPDPSSPVLLTENVAIRSESESIWTFDLDGRTPQRLSEKPILPN